MGCFSAKNHFNKPVAKLDARHVMTLHARDFIEQKNTGMMVLNEAGRAWYRRITASVDPYRTQHHLLSEAIVMLPQGDKQRARINEGESPLGWLRRRKSANGQPFLSLPQYDAEMTRPIKRWLKTHKVDLHLSAKAKDINKAGLVFTDKSGTEQTIAAEKILIAVGRKPNTTGFGLENMAIDMDGAFIAVDDQCRTYMRNVWAIGDVVGEPMLAHKGTAQGEMVAEAMTRQRLLRFVLPSRKSLALV